MKHEILVKKYSSYYSPCSNGMTSCPKYNYDNYLLNKQVGKASGYTLLIYNKYNIAKYSLFIKFNLEPTIPIA